MARKRSRKTKGGSTPMVPILIGAVVLLALVAFFSMSGKGTHSGAVAQDFSIREYRHDGSRLAVPGNRYYLEGRIENIETLGNDRIVSISMQNNRNERLPLLVSKDTRLDVNLTRKDTFIFEVECRTGRDAGGNEVKGILVVQNAKTVQ